MWEHKKGRDTRTAYAAKALTPWATLGYKNPFTIRYPQLVQQLHYAGTRKEGGAFVVSQTYESISFLRYIRAVQSGSGLQYFLDC